MKTKIFFGIVFVFLFLGIVSSMSSPVNLQTLPEHRVIITAVDANSEDFSVLDKARGYSDSSGIFLGAVDVGGDFSLIVYIANGDEEITQERLSDVYSPGELIELDYRPDWYIKQQEILQEMEARENGEVYVPSVEENVSLSLEENVSESEIVEDENPDVSRGFTGNAIFESEFFSSNVFYYILGGIALLVLIITIALFFKKRHPAEKQYDKETVDYLKKLEDTEKKLEDAKKEIDNLKSSKEDNEEEIEKIRQRMDADKRRLSELEEKKNGVSKKDKDYRKILEEEKDSDEYLKDL